MLLTFPDEPNIPCYAWNQFGLNCFVEKRQNHLWVGFVEVPEEHPYFLKNFPEVKKINESTMADSAGEFTVNGKLIAGVRMSIGPLIHEANAEDEKTLAMKYVLNFASEVDKMRYKTGE